MPVQNRIVKVQKRNRALVRFDEGRIGEAILRAARSVGGFSHDFIAGVNDKIFEAHPNQEQIATFLADAVVVGLNANPHHLTQTFRRPLRTSRTKCCTRYAVMVFKAPRTRTNVIAGAATGCAKAR